MIISDTRFYLYQILVGWPFSAILYNFKNMSSSLFFKDYSVREEEVEYVWAVILSENTFGVSYYQHVNHSTWVMSHAPEAQQEFGIGTD